MKGGCKFCDVSLASIKQNGDGTISMDQILCPHMMMQLSDLKINMKDAEIRKNLNIFKLLKNCMHKDQLERTGSFNSINRETEGQIEANHFAQLRISPDGQIVVGSPCKEPWQESVKLRSTSKSKPKKKKCC